MIRFVKSLGGQILLGMVAGILVGCFAPHLGVALKPLGDIFVRGIRMVISPLVLCVVAVGVARAGAGKRAGRIGAKALIYFQVLTTLGLVLGMVVADVFQPGQGMNISLASIDASAVAQYGKATAPTSWLDFLVNLVPTNIVDSLGRGDILQVLVFAILFGLALLIMGPRAERTVTALDDIGHALLRMVGIVMRIAPLAAFGSIAFAVGSYGLHSLGALAGLIACLYGASLVFVLFVFWPITRFGAGLSLWKLLRYMREEIFIALAAASSEAVLPRVLEKLELLGCSRSSVGLVVPAAYSFNLAGSCIYMTLAPLFIAQALNIHVTLEQQLGMLALLLLTSKGAAGVGGAVLVVIATTLTSSHLIPLAGMALILGVDRIQNEVRTLLNLIGNIIAGIVVARSEGEFDLVRARAILDGGRAAAQHIEIGLEGLPEQA